MEDVRNSVNQKTQLISWQRQDLLELSELSFFKRRSICSDCFGDSDQDSRQSLSIHPGYHSQTSPPPPSGRKQTTSNARASTHDLFSSSFTQFLINLLL